MMTYIPFYAWIAALLFKLLKKDKPWEWTQLEQEAFDVCKQVLVSAPVMAYPIHGKPYHTYSDACDYGVAAILQQVQPIKIADLKGTKLYNKLKRAHDVKEPVPNLVTPINSKVEDILTGWVFRGNWAENFEETEVQIE